MNDATKEDLLAILNEKEDEIEWLKAELDEANHSRELSDADCVTLRKERDEARREVCNLTKWDHYGPRHYAQYRKWDCFKENTDGTK